jgi:hypothetical protein
MEPILPPSTPETSAWSCRAQSISAYGLIMRWFKRYVHDFAKVRPFFTGGQSVPPSTGSNSGSLKFLYATFFAVAGDMEYGVSDVTRQASSAIRAEGIDTLTIGRQEI